MDSFDIVVTVKIAAKNIEATTEEEAYEYVLNDVKHRFPKGWEIIEWQQ